MTMNGINLLWQEFKNFALKGNVIDLAVAVVIGGAFNKVITALVENVLMPLLSYISPSGAEYRSWHLGRVKIGAFLSETLNFLIIALALFFVMVKLFGAQEGGGARPGRIDDQGMSVLPLQYPQPRPEVCPLHGGPAPGLMSGDRPRWSALAEHQGRPCQRLWAKPRRPSHISCWDADQA